MTNNEAIYLGIAIMAIVTFITRMLGPFIMKRVKISPRVESCLNGLSSSVIAAIVVTAMAKGGLRESAAVIAACIIMLLYKRTVVAMLGGVLVAALWTNHSYLTALF